MMEYYKDLTKTKKDRRVIGRKGPRDIQRDQQQRFAKTQNISNADSDVIVKELRSQVGTLLEEISKRPVAQEVTGPANIYTAEEFDKELVKQVTAVIKDSKEKYEKEINSLKVTLESKDETIASKDETIESLKLKVVSETIDFIEDPDRPAIEMIYIDPTEEGDGDDMVPYIEVESKEDVKIGDKVNKLKSLIGGLPKQGGK